MNEWLTIGEAADKVKSTKYKVLDACVRDGSFRKYVKRQDARKYIHRDGLPRLEQLCKLVRQEEKNRVSHFRTPDYKL